MEIGLLIFIGIFFYVIFKSFAKNETGVAEVRSKNEKKINKLEKQKEEQFYQKRVIDKFHKSILNLNNKVVNYHFFDESEFNLKKYSLNYTSWNSYQINFNYMNTKYSYELRLFTKKKNTENDYYQEFEGEIHVTPLSTMELGVLTELTMKYKVDISSSMIDESSLIIEDIEKSLKNKEYRNKLDEY